MGLNEPKWILSLTRGACAERAGLYFRVRGRLLAGGLLWIGFGSKMGVGWLIAGGNCL